MAEVKWVKLSVDLFDNPKIKFLRKQPQGDRLALIWVMLLTKAGRCNDDGRIYLTEDMPYTTKMLSQELGFPEKIMAQALETMEKLGMVAFTEEGYLVLPSFTEHQSLDALEKVREQTRERVARYREKKQNEASMTGNVTVTQCNGTDIEEEREEEKESVEKTNADKPPRKKFSPPSVQDVTAFAESCGLTVDAQRFVNYYTSIGWKVGKNPMKDWRAAVRTWQRKDQSDKPKDGPENHWGYVLAPLEDPWDTARREQGYV